MPVLERRPWAPIAWHGEASRGFKLAIRSERAGLRVQAVACAGNASQVDQRTIEYGGSLTVTYNRDATKILSIVPSAEYGRRERRALKSAIATALSSDCGTEVRRNFLHARLPFEGFSRPSESFQVLEASESAPRPEQAVGDWPFVLEYTVPLSPSDLIRNHRSNKRFWELSLFLNAVVRLGLTLPDSSGSRQWVVCSSQFRSRFLQVGYMSDGDERDRDSDGFTSTASLTPIGLLDPQEYFSTRHISLGDVLKLPANFNDLVTKFELLSGADKEAFLRASYWAHVAMRISPTSWSAAFNALTTSVEVFLPNPTERCSECGRPTGPDTCRTCRQPLAGPVQQFREFVELYAPGVPDAHRKKLYGLRSQFTHGAGLMPGDLADIGFRFSPAFNKARTDWDLLSAIVQVVLVNWLNSQHTLEAG